MQAVEPRLLLGLELDTAAAKTDDAAAQRHGGLQAQQQRLLHQPSQTAHGFKKSSGGGGGRRRSARAPRMRWTTALHAHFVHAVELLGGHESMFRAQLITWLWLMHLPEFFDGVFDLALAANFLGVVLTLSVLKVTVFDLKNI
jgi:hypothetical protein